MIRQEIIHRWMGFDILKEDIVKMDVDFLYELAVEESKFRSEEQESDSKELLDTSKEILFNKDAYKNSVRLQGLRKNWDISKCEPLDIKKEGSFYMINNGFHRIKVAKDLGVKELPVHLQEGYFILSKHISLPDLKKLLNMVKLMFPEIKTMQGVIDFLDELKIPGNPRAESMYIGYGNTDKIVKVDDD